MTTIAWKAEYTAAETEAAGCPLCDVDARRVIGIECGLEVADCRNCGLTYVSRRLPRPERNYWGDEQHLRAKYADILSGRRPHDRARNYRQQAERLASIRPTGRLLDIGPYIGAFLRELRNHSGWELHGIDPSPIGTTLCREQGLAVVEGFIEDAPWPDGYFDVISALDVIEHVTTPRQFLRAAHRLLAPDGILYLKTPNVRWNRLKYRLGVHDAFDAREHVVQYDQTSLAAMLAATGFRPAQWFVPLPVQTRSRRWAAPLRTGFHWAARAYYSVSGRLGALGADMACVAIRTK